MEFDCFNNGSDREVRWRIRISGRGEKSSKMGAQLTKIMSRDKIMSVNERAYSSMVEQWPFKPFVLGSSPNTLTFFWNSLLLAGRYFIL